MAAAALSIDLAILLLAATAAGLIARQTGQPTIIAYILAGVVVGPVVLGIVEVTELTETLAELGLAFLLFLLGIKMRLEEVRHVLSPIVKIAIPQMIAIAAVGGGAALALGFEPLEAIIIALAVMYSSTAVVIKMLTDKDEATTLHGKIDVGVLLVQDIVVVILLAVLAAGRPESVTEVATTLVVVLSLVAAITVVALAASRYALPPLFRRIASDRQIFFLIAIAWAFMFIFISAEINLFLEPFGLEAYLSIEMGAFLAGLAIAQLPYSKELQDRVNPLTDLFVMIFFVLVALRIDGDELFYYWEEAVVAAIVLMVAKFIVFFALISWQRFDSETTFLGSLYMVQVSEFGIVVGVAALAGEFIGPEVLGFLTLVALLTMSVSVYFIEYAHRLFERVDGHLERFESTEPFEEEHRALDDHAVIIGYDDVTRNLLPLIDDHYDQVVVVDRRVDHIHELESAGFDAVFGDISTGIVRKEVALNRAGLVISSSDQVAIGKLLLSEVSEETVVILEASDPEDASELYDRGADYVIQTAPLSVGRLANYLEVLLTDHSLFDRAVERDAALLRDPEPFKRIHERMEGALDD